MPGKLPIADEPSGRSFVQVEARDLGGREALAAAGRRATQLAWLGSLCDALAGVRGVNDILLMTLRSCMQAHDLAEAHAFKVSEGGFVPVGSLGTALLTERLEPAADVSLEDVVASLGVDVRRSPSMVLVKDVRLKDDASHDVLLLFLYVGRKCFGAIVVVARDPILEEDLALFRVAESTIAVALRAADELEQVVALEMENRQLVDNLPIMVVRFDPRTGGTSFANAAVARAFGISPADAVGQPGILALLADPKELEASALARERAARGQVLPWADRRYRRKDGAVLVVREHVYPVFAGDGSVRGVEMLAYDVTGESESRKRSGHAERLESLGALAGGIAHEINNPVAFITLAASQLARLFDEIERAPHPDSLARARDLATEVKGAALQITDIVSELKTFTRIPQGAVTCPLDVNRVIENAIRLTGIQLRGRSSLVANLSELPLAPGRYASLGPAVVNLLLHVAESNERREVTVTSQARDHEIVVRISALADHQAASAEPVETPAGVSFAEDMVRSAAGDLRFFRARDGGALCEILLPLSGEDDVAMDAPRARSPEVSDGTKKSVLIIDDEAPLARALARQLEERYDVDIASTADAAIGHLTARAYDAVVCDLRMPDRSGSAIYETVLARSPRQAARFVFTTGGGFGPSQDDIYAYALATGRLILEKPFDGTSFEEVVARVAQES